MKIYIQKFYSHTDITHTQQYLYILQIIQAQVIISTVFLSVI